MREARPQIAELGADILGVGRGADYQAQHLHETEDYGFELLLDADGNLTDRLGMHGFAWWKWLLPTTWWTYLRWMGKASQGRPLAGTVTAQPGVVIVDPSGRVVWAHRGEVVGDYPSIEDVLTALREITDS